MTTKRRQNSTHRQPHPNGGFTLLEIMLVLVIMGVLFSLAIPSFHLALEQSQADLAGANLRAIWTAERIYWLDNQIYSTDLNELQSLGLLDPSIVSATDFYTYSIASADATTFMATATRAGSARWSGTFTLDQTGTVSGDVIAPGESAVQPGFQ